MAKRVHNSKGQVTISRISGDTDWIEIRIIENNSRVEFVTARLSFEGFAKALTGLGNSPAELELINLSELGRRAENKEEFLKCDGHSESSRHKAVRKTEVDGWESRAGDVDNHHRIKASGVSVVFFRHVGKSFVEEEVAE